MENVKFLKMVALAALAVASPVSLAAEDPEKMREENIELARTGNTDAQFNMGRSFCCGESEYHDIQKATWWFCDAARKNHKDAQHTIGQLYRSDRSVEVPAAVLEQYPQLNDDVLAYAWLKLAEKNGYEGAGAEAAQVKAKLSKAKLREAESMIPFYPQIPCEIEVGASEEETQQAEDAPEAKAAPAAGE